MKRSFTLLFLVFTFGCLHIAKSYILDKATIDQIFDQINQDGDDTLEGDEIHPALVEAVTQIFARAKYYKDNNLIKEIALQYAKQTPGPLTKQDFKTAVDQLFNFAKDFRRNAYIETVKKLEMNEVLEDSDLLEEVMRAPDVYGIAYNANQELFDEIDKVYREAQTVIEQLQTQFKLLIEAAQREQELADQRAREQAQIQAQTEAEAQAEPQDSASHTVNIRQLEEVTAGIKEGVHHVQEGAEAAGHTIQENVHAATHRVQEGVQEGINTASETAEKIKHRAEEVVAEAGHKIDEVVDKIKETIHGGDKVETCADCVENTADAAKIKATEAGHKIEETAHAAGHSVQEGYQETVDRASETIEKVKHGAEELGSKVEHKIEEGRDKVQEAASHAAESIKEGAQDVADTVKEGLHIGHEKTFTEKVKEAAGHIHENIKEGLHKVGEAIGIKDQDL